MPNNDFLYGMTEEVFDEATKAWVEAAGLKRAVSYESFMWGYSNAVRDLNTRKSDFIDKLNETRKKYEQQAAAPQPSDRAPAGAVKYDPVPILRAMDAKACIVGAIEIERLRDELKIVGDAYVKMLRDSQSPSAWSGWACISPGKLPRIYAAREDAEMHLFPGGGDRLMFLQGKQI